MPTLGTFNREVPTGPMLPNWNVKVLHDLLLESLKHRLLDIPKPPKIVTNTNIRVAVLYSGGLDCTILARISHSILPPDQEIDLINVAFENPRVVQAAKNLKNLRSSRNRQIVNPPEKSGLVEVISSGEELFEISPYETCPDRETGRKTFQELIKICPKRMWRFVAVGPEHPD